MSDVNPIEEPQLMYRQEMGSCGEILGISYEVTWAVVYLAGGSFYIDFPTEVLIIDQGGIELDEEDLLVMKASVLSRNIEELKKAPYYTMAFFGLNYIPNPLYDPDFDPTIDPFEKWGFGS